MNISNLPRFQFRLRTLLLVVLVLSIPLSWLGSRLRSADLQKKAVARLPPGVVWYDWQVKDPDVWINQYEAHDNIGPHMAFWLGKEEPGPKWLRKLLGDDFFWSVSVVQIYDRKSLTEIKYFPHLRELDLWSSNVTDSDLAQLSQMDEIEGIDFNATAISDAGLEHIHGLTHLKKLCLSSTTITDAGLSRVGALNRIQLLNLAQTQITDAGLDELTGLPNLRWLSLVDTGITDAGLTKLAKLRGLKELEVFRTHTTEDGVDRLRKALPQCHIQ